VVPESSAHWVNTASPAKMLKAGAVMKLLPEEPAQDNGHTGVTQLRKGG
jgi:hypothetical protein